MTDAIKCPTCSTKIVIGERCPSTRGLGRCVEDVGHEGWHWSDVGAYPAILRWTGAYSTYACPAQLTLTKWCEKTPGHDGAHNSNGTSWVPADNG